MAPVISAFSFCHSLSLPVAVFVSLIPFHYFPLGNITYQIIISCTRMYTFEKKRENDIKIKPGDRLQVNVHVLTLVMLNKLRCQALFKLSANQIP